MGVPFRKYAGAIRHRRGVPVIANGQVMQAGFTFTNADTRTYFDASGLLQTAAANVPRTTYIGGNPLLWIDGAVEEISGRSADLDNWSNDTSAGAAQDAVGLDGEANTGFTLTDSSAAANQMRRDDTVITSGTSTYYMVCAFAADDAPSVFSRIDLRLAGGTAVRQGLVPDPSDGTYNTIVDQGSIVLDPVQFGDYWLTVMSLTDNNSGNVVAEKRLFPAWNTDGGAGGDSSAQGSTAFGYCGLFKDSFSLMPILTTGGTTASIAADVARLANSVIAGLTQGTLYAEVWMPAFTSDAARHIAELESDANNFIRALHAADGDLDAQITDGGVSQATLAGTDLTVGTLQKVALTFKEDEFSLYRGGTRLATDTSGTVPSVDTLLIGAGLFGGIKTMNVFTTAWSQAQAEAMTT